MSDLEEPRPPPRILRIPPPQRMTHTSRLVDLALLCLAGGVLGYVASNSWLPLAGGASLALATLAGIRIERRIARQSNARRARWLEAHSASLTDPVVRRLSQRLESGQGYPSAADLGSALADMPPNQGSRATIVCMGCVDVPELGDFRFEPEVFSHFGVTRGWVIATQVAALLVCMFFGTGLAFLITSFWNAGVAIVLITAVVLAVVGYPLVWKFVSPAYVRLAPGIVQVLNYGLWGRKPVVRNFPIDAHTTVIVRQRPFDTLLVLSRGDAKHRLVLDGPLRPARLRERLWQALLSTAPTPPLSDEELVG